jgi:hypothetical protein
MELLYYIFGMFIVVWALATGVYAITAIDSDAPKKEKIIVIVKLIVCICLLLNLGS